MSESPELENRPSTSRENGSDKANDNASDDFLNERCPLLFTVDNPPRRNFLTKDHIYITCLSLFVVVAIGIAVYLLLGEGRRNISDSVIMTKRAWNAQESRLNISEPAPPAQGVLLLHTNTKRCWTESECTAELRKIQNDHMEILDEPEIMYNFMIGNDDRIYEGRGWQYLTDDEDSDEEDLLTIAFLGYYGKLSPTEQQVATLETLLKFGVYTDHLVPCYKIVVTKSSPRGLKEVAEKLTEKFNKNKC